jgi:hypothetical protein
MNDVVKLPATPTLTYADLIAHELANVFDMIAGVEAKGFEASIAKDGILVPIKLFEGRILDGRNRYRAAKAVGYRFKPTDFERFTGTYAEAEAYVISTNVNRRHLTNAQKQDLIRKMIEKNPDASNRRIAQLCGLPSHATVGKVRDGMVNSPEVVRFRKFKETWEDLTDTDREAFVQQFAQDIRELLPVGTDRMSGEMR